MGSADDGLLASNCTEFSGRLMRSFENRKRFVVA